MVERKGEVMTLEELRKLRDDAADLRIELLNAGEGSETEADLYLEHGHATDAYEASALQYVDSLLDAMTASDAVVRLWEAANEYHMARGGGVLSFEAFRDLIAKPPEAKS